MMLYLFGSLIEFIRINHDEKFTYGSIYIYITKFT